MSNPRLSLLALWPTLFALLPAHSTAQDWPHWRGPNFDGSATAKGLPVKFTRSKHVRWKATMPGPGACTPIVVGKRVFLTAVDPKRERLVALCLDFETGKPLWQKDAGSGYRPDGAGTRIAKGRRSNYASPSPASDGERVVFFFGNGDLVAYDFAGEEQWRHNIQKENGNFQFNWTFSASPTCWQGMVYLPVLQRDEPVGRRRPGRQRGAEDAPPAKIDSFVVAFDAKTGAQRFKQVRPSKARVESLESYTTMIPHTGKGGRKELLLAGGDALTAHDPSSGKELWRWGTWNPDHRERFWRLVPSVVVGGDVALVCAPKNAPVYAIRTGGDGALDQKAKLWQSGGRPVLVTSDVPTPAYHDGHFYVLSDVRYNLSKVRVADGGVVWTTKLTRDYLWRGSPTIADGKVFCINHNGEVAVVDAGSGKVLHNAFLGEESDDQTRSSVVIAHDRILVRTNATLFCFGG